MRRLISGAALLSALTGDVAHANHVAAIKCAGSLQPQALLIFNAVNQTSRPNEPLRKSLEARVRELVFTDRLTIGGARPAAEAASECLRIERNCSSDVC
jgi:hypothetical protein